MARRKLDEALPALEGALLPQAAELGEALAYQTELTRREAEAIR